MRTKKGLAALLAVALTVTGLAITQLGASAQKVGNPGPFNLRIDDGLIMIKETDFSLERKELAACADGEDNDEDGLIDFPEDTQCSSALDNSELVSGLQPKEDVVFAGTIQSNGSVTIPQSGIYFPPAYLEAAGSIITAKIQPTANATGSLDPLTGLATVNASLQVKLEGSASGVDLGSNCRIGPLNLSLTTDTSGSLTGVRYNPDTGSATLVSSTFAVPGAAGCGPLNLANGPINDELGLPSPAGSNTATLVGSTNPTITRGVNANVTASTTSGAAPLTVNFNGTSSTATNGIQSYSWDLGNGTTASTPTAFTTYTEPGTYTANLTVTDNDGDTNTESVTITVAEPLNIAPTAAIGSTGTLGNAPYAVSFSGSGSSDPDGTIAGYAWDFGNGQTATGENASVTYTQAGTYTTTLTVTDDDGATGTATQVITVNPTPNVPPTAVARVVSTAGTIPYTVNLSGSTSTDSDGTISSYDWDLGNGTTATGVTTQVTYTEAGTYNVVLTVTDDDGDIGTQTLQIEVSEDPNTAPNAAFTQSANGGTAPLSVDFDASSSEDIDGTIASYAWNFGNGQSGTGATPQATYTVPGTYQVTLNVTDNRGAVGTATSQVVVTRPPNQPPTAQLAATPTTGTAPLLVQLSSAGSSDPEGAIASYSWNYGNGQTGTGPNPSVIYNTPGTYVVTLTVTDGDGATNARSTTVTVTAPNQAPVPVIVATPTSGAAPLLVNVNGANSSDPDGSIVSYAWTFGNGQTATGPTASVSYTTAGSYTIRLTVTDDAGVSRSVTRSIIVSTANQRPTASFTAIPTSGPAPLLVSVDAGGSTDPDGVISNYSWNFGNGATSTGLRTQTTYTTPGIYVITLTVTDNRGGTATSTETVVVDPPQTVTDRVRLSSVGAFAYNYEGAAAGNLRVATDAFGVVTVTGSGEYVGQGGSTARVTVQLERFLWFNAYSGGVRVADPGNANQNVYANVFLQPLSRPSATSIRGTVAANQQGVGNFTLTYTIDDRA